MTVIFKKTLWANFGAAIDMLLNAISLCPDALWYTDKKFFYMAYHTTIFLDYYLTIPVKGFKPDLPYSIMDAHILPPEAIDDVIPTQHYSRQEMVAYVSSIRTKGKRLILQSSNDIFTTRWIKDDETSAWIVPVDRRELFSIGNYFLQFSACATPCSPAEFYIETKDKCSPGLGGDSRVKPYTYLKLHAVLYYPKYFF